MLILRTYEAMCPTCDEITDVGLPASLRAESQGAQLHCRSCGTDWILKVKRVNRCRSRQLQFLNIRIQSSAISRMTEFPDSIQPGVQDST